MQLPKVPGYTRQQQRLLAIAFDPYFGKPKIDHITFPLLLIASKLFFQPFDNKIDALFMPQICKQKWTAASH